MEQMNSSLILNNYTEFTSQSRVVMESAGNNEMFAVMYVDITGFQMINDFYGFTEGDRFLKALADFLAALPRTQLCGRVFSDHFIRLAKFDPGLDIAALTVEYEGEIVRFLEEQYVFHKDCKVHIACGYCVIEKGAEGLVRAIDDANQARKEAKGLQRSAIIWFNDEMRSQMKKKKDLEVSIQKALRDEEFYFYLQPKVNLDSGKIVGAEALARWIKEDGTMVYPDDFIPVMERNQSITDLDFLIYRKVCIYLRKRLDEGKKVMPISVNMSRIHVYEKDAAGRLHAMAANYEIPPYLLEFELTETVLLEEFDIAKQVMDQLSEYGYKTSIDDFGSGFTGVNIWRKLNFDVVKLDKNFISLTKLEADRNDIIIESIAYVGNRLETVLLCEGVETMEQCSHMKNLGCDIAQGYYFSRPVSPEDFEELLKTNGGYFSLPWIENSTQSLNPEYLKTGEITPTQMRSITHSLLHIMPCGMAGFDESSSKLMFLSDKLLGLLGYTREEFIRDKNENWKERIFPPGQPHKGQKNYWGKFESEGYLSLEYAMTNKEGDMIYLSLYAARVSTPEFGTYVLCCFFDETEHRKAADMASQMQNKLNVLMDSFHGGMARMDLTDDYRVIEATDSYYSLIGYTREELEALPNGRYGKAVLLEEDIPGLAESVERMLAGKQNHAEYRICKKDGSIAWNAGYITNMFQENGHMIADTLFLDITGDKEEELERFRLYQFYREIYNSVDCGIIQFCRDENQENKFCCINMNDYALDLFGFTDVENVFIRGMDIMNDFIVREHIQEWSDEVSKLRNPGESAVLEFKIKSLKGIVRLVTCVLKIILDQKGNAIYLCVLVDNSEKKEINKLKDALNTVMDNTPGDVLVLYVKGDRFNTDYITNGLAKTFGYTKEEYRRGLNRKSGIEFIYEEDRKYVVESVLREGAKKNPIDINFRAVYRDGSLGWHNFSADYCWQGENGESVYHGIVTNVNKLKEQEEALKRSGIRYRMAAEIVNIDIWSYDFQSKLLDMPVAEQLSQLELNGKTQITRDEFIENGNIHPDYIEDYLSLFHQIKQGKESAEVELMARVKGNEYQWFRLKCKVVAWSVGSPVEMVGISKNIQGERDNQKSFKELQKKARLDSLTGLYNREAAQKLIEAELEKHRDNGEMAAFLMVDIDNFKSINDNFGHLAGDRIIQSISRTIESGLPNNSILGRLGGDEFMIFISRCMYESDIYKAAKDVCNAVNGISNYQHRDFVTSVSIGIAFAEEGSRFADLYKKADDAMYQVKNSRKNGYAVSESQ